MRVATVVARAAAWWAAAALVVASAPTAVATPAAAACEGVTVVVDHHTLGGEDLVDCAHAGTAAEAFDEVGVALEFLPQQPGFVCRVGGLPESGPCFDGDAYWSLWWSDGSTEWTYASLGVTALEIPAGGAVAFSWHEGDGDAGPPTVVDPADRGCPDWPVCDDQVAAPAEPGSEAEADSSDPSAGDGSFPVWAAAGLAALVLGAAAVPLARRRREERR